MYALYSLLTAAGMLLLSPYFLIRGLIDGKYLGHVRERLGWGLPPELRSARFEYPDEGPIWIHAVSVGEVLAAQPLALQLKHRYGRRRLIVSTTTATGQKLARERIHFADAIFYFPLDWKGPVRRALKAVRPAIVIVMETEIWPNFLRECRRSDVPVIFVNGRLSQRSFRGFQRAISLSCGLLRGFLRRILSDATLFLMQGDQDASRLLKLGAESDRVLVTGNLKYDLSDPPESLLSTWIARELSESERHPVLIAGSVLADEEEQVLRAFAEVERQFPRAVLILAPRKPERFDAAARIVGAARRDLVRRSGITLNGARNSILAQPGSVFLLDSVGELAGIYRLADAVFVGGSLVPGGGHNILEPAAFSKVPVYGPSMDNFREMSAKFLGADAALQVNSAEGLGEAWIGLLKDGVRALRMGVAARSLVEQNRGATARALGRIEQVMDSRGGRI
jgi:3-deoxy-D-manno-octulosonic-acid transferase